MFSCPSPGPIDVAGAIVAVGGWGWPFALPPVFEPPVLPLGVDPPPEPLPPQAAPIRHATDRAMSDDRWNLMMPPLRAVARPHGASARSPSPRRGERPVPAPRAPPSRIDRG